MTQPALHAAASRYYDARPGIRMFRLGLGAVQRLWPALAVRAAYRLFATPLPLRLLRARPQWARDWRIESWPFEAGGLTLYTPADGDGPTGLLGQGWGGPPGPAACPPTTRQLRTGRRRCWCTAGAATPARCSRWPRPCASGACDR